MIKLTEGIKVFVSATPIDARKSIDGLTYLVKETLGENPQSGHLFLFFNKSRDKVKIIAWDRNGFILHYKRLEKYRFVVPHIENGAALEITETQLHGLLAGLDFMLMRKFSEINYYHYT